MRRSTAGPDSRRARKVRSWSGSPELLSARRNWALELINTRLNASNFDFLQAPGGNLNASSPATVTLTPCPLGVAGSNTNHFLRILDSVAGNENVLVTGGSCTSGASSGTVQFTPSLSHSSANWTLISASEGIQESIWESGLGTFVYLDGSFNVWATISIPSTSVTILGKGHGNAGSTHHSPKHDPDNLQL